VPSSASVVENTWYPVADIFGSDNRYVSQGILQKRLAVTGEGLKRSLGLRALPIAVEERSGSLMFRAAGIAGAVHLLGTNLQIVPKFFDKGDTSNDWNISLLSIVRRARRKHFTYSPIRRLGLQRSTFIDHVALAFIDSLPKSNAADPIRTYRTVEESILVLRGRLSMGRQIRSVLRGGYKLECDIDYLDPDNQFNQLLHWAARRFAMFVSDPRLRSSILQTLEYLPPISGEGKLPVRLPLSAPPQYQPYAESLEIASQLASGFTHSHGSGIYDGYGFLLNMEKIFEAFIERTMGRCAAKRASWVSKPQESRLYALACRQGLKSYFTRPDNALYVNGKASLLIDAKYKSFIEAEEKTKLPQNSDLYQMFASLVAHDCTRGLLVYPRMIDDPSSFTNIPAAWTVVHGGTGLKVTAVTLDLTALTSTNAFDELEANFSTVVQLAME